MKRIYFFALGILLTSCVLEVFESHFNTMHEAIDAGLVEKGWISPMVPKSAVDIYEAHDIDTGYGLVRFSLSSEDFVNFEREINKVKEKITVYEAPKLTKRFSWWPQELRNPTELNKLQKMSYQLYKVIESGNESYGKHMMRWYVLHKGSLTVYGWH